MTPPVPIEDQIACINREIGIRQRMYPHLVASGKLRHEVAAKEMAALNAVLETLRRLRDGQAFREKGDLPVTQAQCVSAG